MAKQTKRQRKFQATGGVKKRIDKGGTIAKGGKVRNKGRKANEKTNNSAGTNPVKQPSRDRTDDLVGKANLGDLDIDSFFAQFSEEVTVEQEDEGDDEVDDAESEEVDNDDNVDDDDNEELGENSDDDDDDGEGEDQDEDEMDCDNGVENSDSENDDSDDEDVDMAEARMKAQMAKMQRNDPEFHDFLKQNEETLLDFGTSETGVGVDPTTDTIDDDDDKANERNENANGSIQLTKSLLISLSKGTFESHGIKSLKRLVSAYKSACHVVDANDTTNDSSSKHRPGENGQNYQIDSPQIYDKLLVLCLNRLHEAFKFHLVPTTKPTVSDDSADNDEKEPSEEMEEDEHNKPISPKTLEKSPRWLELKPILLSFFRSTLHIMAEAKEPDLLAFILKKLSKYIRFMTPFPRMAEAMLKALTGLWSAPLDSSEEYQVVRLNAFLRIRQLALTQPYPFIEDCLKKTYLAYSRRAKFGSSVINSPSLPTLTFMGNCLVELYSLDFHSSYQHAFVYIRQMALLLRAAMHKKTPDAVQQVYCWQYMNCLKLWVAVLSATAPATDGAMMRSLLFPLTEIILGTARFVAAPVRHMPLTFHCVRLLQQLAAAAGDLFIPTTPLLLDVLDWKEWTMPPKKSKNSNQQHASSRGLPLHLMLKLGKTDPLRSHEQLEAGIKEFFLLLNREVELYRYSAGFPEFSMRIVMRLRQFSKMGRNPRWRTYVKACIETCERYSAFAVQSRSQLAEAPRDVKLLECLKPVAEKSMRERHEESVAKEQSILDVASSSITTKEAKLAAKSNDDDDENDSDGDDIDDDKDEKEKQSKASQKRRQKSRAAKAKLNPEDLAKQLLRDDEIMEAADEVQDGVQWSDDDDE